MAPDTGPVTIQVEEPCQICCNLDPQNNPTEPLTMYPQLNHFNIPLYYFEHGSKSGCVYCTLLYKIEDLCRSELEANPGSPESRTLRWYFFSPQSPTLTWMDDNKIAIEVQLSLCPGSKPWGWYTKPECTPSAAGSSESLNFAKEQLRNCIEQHQNCRPARTTMPTRVLSVAGGHYKIVEPNGEPQQYAALSHCWGSSRQLELKAKSEELMKQAIPWARFPRTYQDAITVCQKLGIDFLWIDSLCIKQDDRQDWEREASKMVSKTDMFVDLAKASRLMCTKTLMLSSHRLVVQTPKNHSFNLDLRSIAVP